MADALDLLQRRYGSIDLGTPLVRLEMKLGRTRNRREAIQRQIADLETQRAQLEEEERRMQLLRQELVADMAESIRARHGEGWSPAPVVGYRLWEIHDGALVGATGARWTTSELTATCVRAGPHDDIPHTDRLCSSVGHGCGIYAMRHPALLDNMARVDAVAGIVLLSGKVVEHDQGYRAAHARVAGVVAHAGSRYLASTSLEQVEALFADPWEALSRFGSERCLPLSRVETLEVLEQLEKEMEEWT